MNNSTEAKKQTRILIVSVAIIAAFASVMILITALQGRKAEETKPPLTIDTGTASDTSTEKTHVRPEETSGTETSAMPEETSKTDLPADSDAAQVNTPEDVLPDFIAPLSGTVSHAYSVDVPVYSLTMNDYRTHAGIDIAAERGTPVHASAAGTITDVWEDPLMGKCIRIEHAGGAVSIYKNLAPETPDSLCTGAAVESGAVIGTVGESALLELADEPHLHYELMIDGTSVDPADFMLLGTTDTAYEG